MVLSIENTFETLIDFYNFAILIEKILCTKNSLKYDGVMLMLMVI